MAVLTESAQAYPRLHGQLPCATVSYISTGGGCQIFFEGLKLALRAPSTFKKVSHLSQDPAFSTQEKVALPAENPERKGSQNTMAGEDNKKWGGSSWPSMFLPNADLIPEIQQLATLQEAEVV